MFSMSSLLNSISSLVGDTSTIQNSINSTLSDENSAVVEFERSDPIAIQYKKDLEVMRLAQAGEVTRTTQSVIASRAPTDYREVRNVIQVVNNTTTNENLRRERFRRSNIQLETQMVGVARGNTDLQNNTNVLTNTNNYIFGAESDDSLKSQIDLYISQSQDGKPASFTNRQSIIDQIENRDDISQNSKDALINSIDDINDIYESSSDVVRSRNSWAVENNRYQETVEERNAAEERLRQLMESPNFEELAAQLNDADQATLERLQLEIAGGERPTDDLEASGFANSNKVINDALTGAKGAAPLYLQLPTMKAITDFRLRNGYSPFGATNIGDVARDAIHINIFAGALPDVEVVNNNGIQNTIIKSSSVSTLGNITIFPNNPDWLSFSHNHQYSDENPLSSIANPILNFIGGAATALRAIQNIRRPEGTPSDPTSARVSARIDFIDQYQSTDKLSITVPFILFTKGDFIADIYRPLMFMTALSYPIREFGTVDSIQENLTTLAKNELPESLASTTERLLNTDTAKDLAAASQDIINKGNIGAFRFVISRRPEYLSVRHASGLFYFKLAVITNLSYNFKGPWINSIGDVIDAGPSTRSQFNRFVLDRNKNKTKLPFAFPSIAECNITFKSVEPLFRQDWLNLLNGASDFSGQGLVRVSEANTGFTSTANGERINFNNVAVGATNPPNQRGVVPRTLRR